MLLKLAVAPYRLLFVAIIMAIKFIANHLIEIAGVIFWIAIVCIVVSILGVFFGWMFSSPLQFIAFAMFIMILFNI